MTQPLPSTDPPPTGAWPPPPAVPLRAAVGEGCHDCGCLGAGIVRAWRVVGLVVVWVWMPRVRWLCRDCGRAELLDAQALTLLLGWWGLPSLLALPVVLVVNAVRLRRLRQRPPPGLRDPFVVTRFALPRAARPLHRRPLLWLLLAGFVAAVAAAQLSPP